MDEEERESNEMEEAMEYEKPTRMGSFHGTWALLSKPWLVSFPIILLAAFVGLGFAGLISTEELPSMLKAIGITIVSMGVPATVAIWNALHDSNWNLHRERVNHAAQVAHLTAMLGRQVHHYEKKANRGAITTKIFLFIMVLLAVVLIIVSALLQNSPS